jgi:nitrogen-specific signal transduction histidine kinase
MKIKTIRQIYLIFTIVSLLIAGIVTYFVKQNNLSYNFRLDKKELFGVNKNIVLYADLNNDGISEQIKVTFFKELSNDYINIISSNGSVLEQINLFSKTNEKWFLFEDYNNDNNKEIIAFSQLNDSLYLTIFDLSNNKTILRRQFIFSKPDSAFTEITKIWDIDAEPIALLNVDNDDAKELLFVVRGGYSIFPRGIYTYDIEDKRIISKFESGVPIHKVIVEDINNNGEEEIICSTVGPANIHKNITYSDNTSWLFVFNKKLQPIFKPINYGKEFTNSYTIPIKQNNSTLIMFKCNLQLKSGRIGKYFLYNSKGTLLDSLEELSDYYLRLIKTEEENRDVLYLSGKNSIIKLDENFNIIKTNNNFNHRISLIAKIPIEESKEKVVLAKYDTEILLFSKELKLLAKYNLDDKRIYYQTIKYNGKNKQPQLTLVDSKNSYLFTIVENKLYSYLPLIFLGSGLLSFFIFYIFHLVLTFLSTYTKYFGYSLNKSAKGVAIFNYNGKVFYSNKNIKEFLKLKTNLEKGSEYKNIFNNHKDILSTIATAIKTQKKTKEKIQISSSDFQFEGSVTITPFTSFIGFTYAYLMEISDYTEALLTDRGKIWGATLQRIAHEIKTPLSGINLGLDTLAKKLSRETDKYTGDIVLIQNEVNRIKALTKNFLLFSNMEKPNFTKVKLNRLLEESIDVFNSYLNSGIELTIQPTNYIVLGDELQLKQLFNVIIENAIDACGGKGKIDIRFEKKEIRLERQDTRKTTNKNEVIKIIVSDNGKGISEEKLSKIFEPYFTTKKDGTGIGLAIAKKIVEDHKGQIKVESKLNKGTTVYIYL